jgi:predicted permease
MLPNGIRRLFRLPQTGDRLRHDMDDEIRAHLDMRVADLGALGMSAADAEAEARRRFGDVEDYRAYVKYRAASRARRRGVLEWLGDWWQDLRFAARQVRLNSAFTALAVVTLALGIGANAAAFTVLDLIFLRPPAGVADPASLQGIWYESSPIRSSEGKSYMGTSAFYAMYAATAASSVQPASVAAYQTDFALFLKRDGQKTKIRGVFASASYFPVLGVRAALGRLYTAREDSIGDGTRVVVIGDRLWRREFGGDSAVLGRRIRIETDEYTVIGVLPAGFDGLTLQATDVWMPIAAIPSTHWLVRQPRWWERGNTWSFHVIRRPVSGDDAFEQRATSAVRETQRRAFAKNPDTLMTVHTAPMVGTNLGTPGQEMLISSRLSGVAAIVLVIACANVINLLLARAVRRRREIAVRLALGVSRLRLVRLLTTETVLLAAIAGGAALLVAWWGGTYLRAAILPEVQWYQPVLHWRVLLFAGVVALLAGAVAGVVPALQASTPQLTAALKEGSRDGVSRRSRLRQGLVVVQAALSVTLLVGAALFVRSLKNVRGLDLGFDADRVVFGWVAFEQEQKVPTVTVAATMSELAARLAGRSGVEVVARANDIPMNGISFITFFWGADSSASLTRSFPTFTAVSPEYFAAVGLRLTQGTTFSDAANEVIVNEATSALLWPRSSAVGQCMHFEKRDAPCYTVVGVVENSRQSRVIEAAGKPQFYLPLGRVPIKGWEGTTLIVRAKPAAIAAASSEIATALRAAFPAGQPTVKHMLEELEPEYRPWRLGASLFSGVGVLALVVAIIGIYSTVSYAVTQRRQEFGVRVALGASVRDVLAQVLGEGLRVVIVGVAAGIALALAAGKLVAALLYGVDPRDPATMVVVSLTLLATAALATLVPAWRASRVDPASALRSE